ncbi:YcxB family protein [Pseudoneobacillus rhizosphaerae]|uniref:YcxB-like C-terminal domain-containing protein n=1 Tax=Pseudoneobacillus rhizosphaerae TaxID=2880968 RepID=A0A9C7LCT5_9BACI|nr:YcxB family protein [Pseudoneobacillus rhizosphaerae]CAG9610398.1 hypothetical protein NEOCIP111885_04172 [Pseudoneobacillus rhizosphaerae]
MDLKYNLTEEDYINFNLFHMKSSPTIMKSVRNQRIFTPVFYLLFSVVFSMMMDIPFLVSFTPFFILSILWVLFYPKYLFGRAIRHTKKLIKEGRNENILGQHQMVLNDEGIVDKTTKGETKVAWSGINELKENDQYFYLYNSALSGYILPKREFENIEEIRNYLNAKMAG